MKKIIFLSTLLCLLSSLLLAQKKENNFVIMSYNVENLFDTQDDPATEDEAFTPEGGKNWTKQRYEKKLDDLSGVILSVPGKILPAVIGLAEVENRTVIEDLISKRGLRKGKYEIVHEDGPDARGIESALIYQPELFNYEAHEYIPVEDPENQDYPYRRILHVRGTAADGSSLHIFMNHWKSRREGPKETEKQRMFTAITLRKQLDLLLSRGSDHKVIIMGDFNDEPTNRSLLTGLSASGKRKNINFGEHYNFFYDMHNQDNLGTYAFRGEWYMLDQLIVSYNLLNQEKGLSASHDGGRIIKEESMLYQSEKYGAQDSFRHASASMVYFTGKAGPGLI